MKIVLTLKIFLLMTVLSACRQTSDKTQTTTIAQIEYIPKNLEDCFVQIDKSLSYTEKIKLKMETEDQFSAKMHFSLGLWMRNNWGLWKGSRLSNYFNKIGIYHPDDMSGIILDSYYRHSTGKRIKLDEQIKQYQNYWKVVKQPSKESFPKGVEQLDFNSGMYYNSKTNGQGYILVGTSTLSKDIWLYDYYHGWVKAKSTEISKLEQDTANRELNLIAIYKHSK